MKYCMSCGVKVLQLSQAHWRCTGCAKDFYNNPKATVAVVLLGENNTVYLAIRALDPQKGKLDCIGGFLDVGENFEQALYREMKEELGIMPNDVTDLDYLCSTHDPYPWQGTTVHTSSVYYVAFLNKGAEIVPNDDVADVRQIRIADLDTSKFAWKGMEYAFIALNRYLATK